MELDDERVGLDDVEVLERVEQPEQVEGDLVERILFERPVERRARGGFVADAQEVLAEVRPRLRIGRVERGGLACERGRGLEAITACRVLGDDPVDFAPATG